MPMIKAKQKIEKEQVRIIIEKEILQKIKAYCDWAGLNKPDEFFQQATEYILAKDKDWLSYANQK